MRLKLTVQGSRTTEDVLVTLDAAATVRDLADALITTDSSNERFPQRAGQATICSHGLVGSGGSATSVTLDPEGLVTESGLRSGSRISLTDPSNDYGAARGPAAASLRVMAGPDAGRQFALYSGTTHLGRESGNDVVLRDPLVSKRHARLRISASVDIVDLESANGVLVDGVQVQRASLTPDNEVLLGDSLVVVVPLRALAGGGEVAVDFNRPPLVRPMFEGEEVEAPEPPVKPRRLQFPVISMLAPLLMGGVLYLTTRNPLTVLFVALSPLLIIASLLDQHRQSRREVREELAVFEEGLAHLRQRLVELSREEIRSRLVESPSTAEAADAADRLSSTMWSRHPDLPGFLTVRLGLAHLPSRTSVRLPSQRARLPGAWERMLELQQEFRCVDGVPVVGDFREAGSLGIAGPPEASASVARSLVLQMVCLHSPSDLAVTALGGATSAREWDWLKWLPHVNSGYSPISVGSLASSGPAVTTLVAQLEALLLERAADRSTSGLNDQSAAVPAVLVVVMDDTPIDRSRLVHLAERGPQHGVHVLWVADSVSRVPACCRIFAEVGVEGQMRVGLAHRGEMVSPVRCETADQRSASRVARSLSPVVDSGARLQDDSDLPRSVSFLAVLGTEMATSHEPVLERWRASDPTLFAAKPTPHRQTLSLRGVVGQAAGEPFHLDLRADGPHALVGGTTGAGKSEFLQTWVLGMAATHSPRRLTFLFVDYKGGSAFANCVNLPHSVGLVTDLRPHLVRRALTSLRAELRHRERILEAHGAKDLIDLEKSGDPAAPPSLVIIVDEFAALIQEVPQFIDGVVDVAQRGRSLGLHLILATQQPSGVIKGNLRANTNLRVALRMADEDDSNDVLGDAMAGSFDPAIPGRAAAKTGPGRLTAFQSLYAGGSTPDRPPRPAVGIESLVFGIGQEWVAPDSDRQPSTTDGPPDISRVVSQVRRAFDMSELEVPRKPWLETLEDTYDLGRLDQRRDTSIVIGVQDDPEDQRQMQVAFRPDEDGNMAVFGTGGSGKSTALRTIALSSAATPESGPCDVYGVDFGSRGLAMLENLPHVGAVIAGDDHERIERLLRWLRELIETRSRTYAAVRASTLTEYRELSGQLDEPRILLLLDGMGPFRQQYEVGGRAAWFTTFGQIAADGRTVGVHIVMTADRPSTIPPSIAATIQQRLVLRFADESDYAMLNLPSDVLAADSAPGRGLLNGLETQVAVLGGSANLAHQARSVTALKEELQRNGRRRAWQVRSLPERVALSGLPIAVDGAPTIGMRDDLLEPMGLTPAGIFLVVGPPGSGRTTTTAGVVLSTLRAFPAAATYFFGSARSQLASLTTWRASALEEDAAVSLATELEQDIKSGVVVASGETPVLVVIDSVASFLGGAAESVLQSLVTTAEAHDVFVVAESEISTLTQSWGLGQALRARRRGVALQPEDMDGTTVFRTAFPRMARSEFPPGRGVVVDAGKLVRVQMALPE